MPCPCVFIVAIHSVYELKIITTQSQLKNKKVSHLNESK